MEDQGWVIGKKKDKDKKEKGQIKEQNHDEKENKAIETPKKPALPVKGEDNKEPMHEMQTAIELDGEDLDFVKNFAVLALIDIAPEVKRLRKLPQLFHIKKSVCIIGTGRIASVKLDDLKTVKNEHGAVVFRDGDFYVLPQEGKVEINGVEVHKEGELITNGSQFEMGSAKFIFLTNTIAEDERTKIMGN